MKRYDEPWTYYIIEDFFEPDHWEIIKNSLDGNGDIFWQKDDDPNAEGAPDKTMLGWYLQDVCGPIKKEEIWFKKHFIDQVIKPTCLAKIDYSVFDNPTINVDNLYLKAGLIRCEPDYRYPIHPDSRRKLISVVVYVDGKVEDGTILIDAKTRKETHLQAKPNSVMIFQRTDDTLHYYRNTSDNKYRYTINLYHTRNNRYFNVTPGEVKEVGGKHSRI